MRILFFIITLLIGGQLFQPALAQSPQEEYESTKIRSKGFSEEKWKKVSKKLDYGQKKWVQEEQKAPPKKLEMTPLMKGFLFVIVIVLLAFLIYKLVARNILFGNKKTGVEDTVSVDDLDEDIHESDLERMLRQALEQNALRLAIRIYYLILLRELSEKNHILWKRDKPNRLYVAEMARHKLHDPFRELTRLFEMIWYGDFEIRQGEFEGIQKAFQDTINQAKT